MDWPAWITAAATVLVAGFTAVLYRATNKQAVLTRQSIDLARQEYISTHRPKLSVRHIVPTLKDGEPISIQCTVTNVGETKARLQAQRITLTVFPLRPINVGEDPQPVEPLVSDLWLLMSDLVGGQSEIFVTQRPTAFQYSDGWKLNVMHGGAMFLRGEFLYSDENDVARRMGFSRRYDPLSKRFAGSSEDEDEYQD
jgi:hypothetical protein